MAVRTVRQLGDPVLREKCEEVKDASASEIRALVEDLSDTLAYWRKTTGYGRGIAAPQIGVSRRVIFLRLPGENASSFGTPASVFCPSSCKSNATATSPCATRTCRAKRTRFEPASCETFPSCSSMKSITSMESCASTA